MKMLLMFGLMSFGILISCTKRHVTPTRASRQAIDTIYQKKILVLKPEMDSVCMHVYDSIYPLVRDSILKQRQMEMEALVK